MGDRLLIYGATGYSGRSIAQAARAAGLAPIVCGRSADKLQALARELACEGRVARLDDAPALARALRDARVVLNAAGPFADTSPHLIEACLRAGCHYLDISGEIGALAAAAGRGADARRRGVMLMPGAGFDVVPSDCLALHVARRARRPRHLRIGIAGLRLLSRGSALTLIDQLHQPTAIVREGRLRAIPPGTLEWSFDFGQGQRPSLAVSWGDLITARYSTALDDITTFFEATPAVRTHNDLLRAFGWALPWTGWQALLRAGTALLPEGPSAEQRAGQRAVLVAEIEDADGSFVRSRLSAPEAYTTTVSCALAIAQRVLDGDWQAGFETPARLFGPDFALQLPGVAREDL
jgi:short subunit dehydrogenase-like uncharacterized protein